MKYLIGHLGIFLLLVSNQLIYAKPQDTLSLQDTISTRVITRAQVSPNGKLIAYSRNQPRKVYEDDDGNAFRELYLINEQGKHLPFITGSNTVLSLTWAPDSEFIYFITKRNDDKFKQVYRISAFGGEATRVTEHGNNISAFTISPDNQSLVFIAKKSDKKTKESLQKKGFKAEVYEEDLNPNFGFKMELSDLKKKPVVMDIEGHLLSADYHPTKNQLLVRVAPTPLVDDDYMKSQFRIIKDNGIYLQKFESVGKIGQGSWSPDGKYFTFIGSEDIHDPSNGRLILARASNGKMKTLLSEYQGHFKDTVWVSNHEFIALGHTGTGSELKKYNLDNETFQTFSQPGEVVFAAIAGNQHKMLAIGSTSNHPIELFSVDENTTNRLTVSNPNLEKFKFPRQESISYKARDGLELEGILVYPQNYKKGKRYPLIMMVHGGPESHYRNEWNDRYSTPVKYAAAQGFMSFLPNYRGSTGRGVDFSKLGQGDYAGAEFNDLIDAIDHLNQQGLIDKERVGITGGSYGGYASAWGATALSEHFAASVMFVGISNQLSKFGTTDIANEMYNVHARSYPWEKWQWMLERSPIYHTDKAKTPLLIMHGKNDTRVHPSQSMELYRYIKTRTKTPVRLVFYPGEGHGNRHAAAQLDYAQRLMRWMEFYLKGKNKSDQIPPFEMEHEEAIKKLTKKDQ